MAIPLFATNSHRVEIHTPPAEQQPEPKSVSKAARNDHIQLQKHQYIFQPDLSSGHSALDVFATTADIFQAENILQNVLRPMSGGAFVVELIGDSEANIGQTLDAITNAGLLEYAERDALVTTTTVPDDNLFDSQWTLRSTDSSIAALNLVEAWDITRGSDENIIAIIDTGIRFEHEDLVGRVLPGYDFVSGVNDNRSFNIVPESLNYVKAHDGDGRDPDATDPGDGVDAELHMIMAEHDQECPMQESSWHGTAMASLAAANGNDTVGMTGVDWEAWILPVRAIGRCGGRRSDLLDSIRWAAGVPDPNLPPNPTPARIINLSLGIDDKCAIGDQRAINDAVAMGAFVVAAVGNLRRNLDEQPSSPSHCNNVFGVTAVNSSGLRASYSSYGRDADIAAPGGEGAGGDNKPILVATNDGYLEPQPTNSHRFTTGTSVASPMVAGIISLMLSVNPELSNAELRALLRSSVRPFPEGENPETCTVETCGAGLIDAFAAVTAAQAFDPLDPGPVAAAFLEDESRVSAGGSAMTSPLWLLLFGLAGRFYATSTSARRARSTSPDRRQIGCKVDKF